MYKFMFPMTNSDINTLGLVVSEGKLQHLQKITPYNSLIIEAAL